MATGLGAAQAGPDWTELQRVMEGAGDNEIIEVKLDGAERMRVAREDTRTGAQTVLTDQFAPRDPRLQKLLGGQGII